MLPLYHIRILISRIKSETYPFLITSRYPTFVSQAIHEGPSLQRSYPSAFRSNKLPARYDPVIHTIPYNLQIYLVTNSNILPKLSAISYLSHFHSQSLLHKNLIFLISSIFSLLPASSR